MGKQSVHYVLETNKKIKKATTFGSVRFGSVRSSVARSPATDCACTHAFIENDGEENRKGTDG
jgi:hypothetical protein